LFGFVDNAHAAAADFPKNAIIAELLEPVRGGGGGGRSDGAQIIPSMLDLDQGGQQLPQGVRQLRVAIDVFLDRWPFAPSMARRNLLGDFIEERIVKRSGVGHGKSVPCR